MRLFLIRHGQTPHNITGALDTARPGAGLTPLGQAQAQAIPTALAGEDVAAIYASPLVRTRLTAAPLAAARGLDVQVCEGLEEISAGDLELRTDDEAVAAYLSTATGWAEGELHRHLPGAPDGTAFFTRYDAAIRKIAAEHADDATVVVVSHGTAIRLWSAVRSANVGADHVRGHRLQNTGAAVLVGHPDSGWSMAKWRAEPVGGDHLVDEYGPEDAVTRT